MGKDKKSFAAATIDAAYRRAESFVDDVVALVDPKNALVRKRARFALDEIRGYQGASKSRRSKHWNTPNTGPNEILTASLPTLRARSRDLERNNPHIKKAFDVIVNNVVGIGIVPQTQHKSERVKEAYEEGWRQWAETTACDADGAFDIYGLQGLGLRTVGVAGAALFRKRTRRISDSYPLPIQVQGLEPDYLDTSKDGVLSNGHTVVQGIELDKIGRRVAYYLFKDHPQNQSLFTKSFESTRVAASEVIHLYNPTRFGQVNGVPWASSVIIKSKDLDDYEDAQLFKQKIAGCFTAFIRDIEALEDSSDDYDDDCPTMMRPGTIAHLPPGKDITFANPPTIGEYSEFTRNVLRAIAAGFGITYEALTTDYSQVNFSSARMGWLEFHRQIELWQNHIIIPKFCATVWDWFTEAMIMSGKVTQRATSTWTTPRREMIDPVKETVAIKEQLRIGLKSRSEAIREMGYDPIAVDTEIAEDNKRADKLGLKFDSDPRVDDLDASTFMED